MTGGLPEHEAADRRSAVDFLGVGARPHLLETHPPTDPINPLLCRVGGASRKAFARMSLKAMMLGLAESRLCREVAVNSVTSASGSAAEISGCRNATGVAAK